MCPIVNQLNSDLLSEERRQTALKELMDRAQNNMGDPSSIPPLLVVLEDGSLVCRQMASWTLGKLAQVGNGDQSELDPLIASLQDDDGEIRENSAWALGELAGQHIGRIEEIMPLTTLLRDDAATIRGMSAWALGRLAQRMNLTDRRSVEPLEGLLSDKSLYVSKGAEYALQRLKENLTH
jgi:HEAT repeat protein